MRYWVKSETFDMGSMKDKALKPLEEASEAREAVEAYWPTRHSDITETRENLRHKAIYECCDTLQATCNLLAALGVTQQDLDATMDRVHEHNRERGRYE